MNAPYYQSFHHKNDVRAFVTYCFDPDLVVEGITGGFRAITPDDLSSSVSLSGDLNVGNVGVTGGSLDSVGTIDSITYLQGGLVGLTGTVTIANGVSINLTGSPNVTVANWQNGLSVNITGSPTVTVSNPVTQVGVTGDIAGTITDVAIAATATGSLLMTGTNTSRQGLYVFNNTNSNMFCRWGSAASLTRFTFMLDPSGLYEMPKKLTSAALYAIWDGTPTGSGLVTEMV